MGFLSSLFSSSGKAAASSALPYAGMKEVWSHSCNAKSPCKFLLHAAHPGPTYAVSLQAPTEQKLMAYITDRGLDTNKLSPDKTTLEIGRWPGSSATLKDDLYKLRKTLPELPIQDILGAIETDMHLRDAGSNRSARR